MALAWALRDRRVTSALVGARSRPEQAIQSAKALDKPQFPTEELEEIDDHAGGIPA